MAFRDETLEDFGRELASRSATPGGGAACALVGSLAAALGEMVCNLSIKGQAEDARAAELSRILSGLEDARVRLLTLADDDAASFSEVSAAYRLSRDDPARTEAIERALEHAAEPPLRVLETCTQVVAALEDLLTLGSDRVLSDVGVAASLVRSAGESAVLNVCANTRLMHNAEVAARLDRNAADASAALAGAQRVYDEVLARLRRN